MQRYRIRRIDRVCAQCVHLLVCVVCFPGLTFGIWHLAFGIWHLPFGMHLTCTFAFEFAFEFVFALSQC